MILIEFPDAVHGLEGDVEDALGALAHPEALLDHRERLGADHHRGLARGGVDARDLAVVAPRRHQRFEPADLGEGLLELGAEDDLVELGRGERGEDDVRPHGLVFERDARRRERRARRRAGGAGALESIAPAGTVYSGGAAGGRTPRRGGCDPARGCCRPGPRARASRGEGREASRGHRGVIYTEPRARAIEMDSARPRIKARTRAARRAPPPARSPRRRRGAPGPGPRRCR